MEDLYGGGGLAALDIQDFHEEEVWAMVKAIEGSSVSNSKSRNNFSKSPASSPSSSAWRVAATSRAIPRSTSSGGGTTAHQSSAPVNIPDWSKILKKKAKNMWDDGDDDVKVDGLVRSDVDDDGNGYDYDEMVPPHEYLARRLSTAQVASFSMCEGIGRTLKGRDLSNLRNAILTKTGFLE